MGMTDYAANDAMAVKLWSRMLSLQSLDATDIKPLIGNDENSIIQMKDETSKGKGDQITYGLQIQLQGRGFSENDVAEGNGESLATYSDALTINELGHMVGIKSEVTIDAQRVPFEARAQARMGLKDWWKNRYSVSAFNQLCGNTAQSDTYFTGMQATVAPSSTGNRIIRQNGRTADESLVPGDVFTYDLIDKAKEQATAKQLDSNNNPTIPRIRPVNIGGDEKYVICLNTRQITDLRTNTGNGQWQEIQKAAMAGRDSTKSPIFTGALGEYNGCVLRRIEDLPNGVNSSTAAAVSNTTRAVLLGAQAGAIAFGQKYENGNMRWHERLYDAGRRLEVSAWRLWGLKKVRFNSIDFGTVVISTYAAAHT